LFLGVAAFKNNADIESKFCERKTIYVNAKSLFIKLRFDDHHIASYNKVGQVGIMGVKVNGENENEMNNEQIYGHEKTKRTLTMDPHGAGGTVDEDYFSDGYESDDFYASDIVRRDRQKRKDKEMKKDKKRDEKLA
jgi:hypothetical protein